MGTLECNTLARANQLQRLLVPTYMDSRTNLETQGSCADDQRLTRVQLLPAGVCLRRART